MSTILGRPITMGGGGKLPDIFGDGSDGDLVIKAGETVTLPVAVPHQSVIEKNYASITIEAGGTLTTADYNAGLVLRCQGDCNISGTIDQSGKAPKTNPDSTYQYPAELVCGAGGNGGAGQDGRGNAYTVGGPGGAGMAARVYGGGYGGGGGGGAGVATSGNHNGGAGGSADVTTAYTGNLFIGGAGGVRSYSPGSAGSYGGGGGGSYDDGDGGDGGNGPGADGISNTGAGGGGAGNTGGGVVLIYSGGAFNLTGFILCNGKDGGIGATGGPACTRGGGGGGGGGGAIYICYNKTQTITGSLLVNGGTAGSGYNPGQSGGIGTTTIKQYEKGMTA
jgi:hypothetical protein